MKNLKRILFFLIFFSQLILTSNSYLIAHTYSSIIDSTEVRYFYNNFDNLELGNIYNWDTTTILSSYYDKLDKKYELFQTLSNSGMPNKRIDFEFPVQLGFNSCLSSFYSYLNTSNNIKCPIIYQPFTEIKYTSGANKEQYLEVFFSREFLPRLFITLNYDVDFSPGLYKRSKIQNSFFNGNIRYNAPKERYGIIGAYFHNKIYIQENGGIIYDSIFTNNLEQDKSIIDVNLTSATNLVKVSGFVINQYLNLSANSDYAHIDSTRYKGNFGMGRINHHFSFQRNRYIYDDNKPLSSFYQNYDVVQDSLKTSDSVYFYTVKNAIYWNSLGSNKYNQEVPFYLTFGVEHDFTRHCGYWNYQTKEYFKDQNFSSLSANAGLIINLFKSTRITGKAQIITTGYHAGDFYIDGQWKQFLGTSKKNLGALKFDININRQSPDWFEEYYYSNNFRWDNDFDASTSLLIKGSYELPFVTIGFKQTTIDDYVYFGTDAKPKQYSGTLSISSLYSTFNLKFNKLEMVGFASLQSTNNKDVIHLPTFQAKMKIAYNITLVKNNSMMQPSLTIKYFTKYYADAYMPALRTFYLQNEVQVGNFPYIDLCVTFKIKRANIYVLYTNMYSLTNDNRYLTIPHYPMRDSRLCFGINWRLYK
jgi:hypothetical protein